MTATLLRPSCTPPLNAPTVHYLSNGLTIVAEQMPVEAVNLSLWLNVGSTVESDDINGMAHFLEHMVFKGTQRLCSGEFEGLIEQQGAMTNAATSQDYTHYYITTAPQDFAELAPLQVDVVMNASIPEDGFERERHVVLEEIRRSQDNPRRRIFQHASELTFEQMPYRRQVLGPASVIEQLTPQQMRDFHTRWYRPESITAVAVGNLPVEELTRIVVDSFDQAGWSDEGIKRWGDEVLSQRQETRSVIHPPQPSSLTGEIPFQSIVRHELTDPSFQQARLVMTWRVPGMNTVQQTYALDMLASVLGHGRTSRLVQDLREQRGLVSSISASNVTYQHQGAFYIVAYLPAEHLEEVEAAIAQHIRTLQTELITDWEVNRVRTRVANHYIFGNETPSDRAGIYGYYQSLLGDLTPALNYPARIQALSANDLRSATQQHLSPDAYGVVVIRPGQ